MDVESEFLREARIGLARLKSVSLVAPSPGARVQRFLWAITIHVAVLRLIWADRPTRSQALRAWAPQLAVLLGVLLLALVTKEAAVGDYDTTLGEGLSSGSAHSDGFRLTFRVDRGFSLETIGTLIGTLKAAEWILVALTRQFGDALTVAASSLVGVPPDDVVTDPRVRLDLRWLWTKLKRRISGGLAFIVSAAPMILLLDLVLLPLFLLVSKPLPEDLQLFAAWFTEAIDNEVVSLLLFAWIGIFTLGKTGHAWTNPGPADFVLVQHAARVRAWFAPRVPFLARVVGIYERLLRRATRFMRSPSEFAGRMPWETAGLVVVRILFSVPGLYLLGRPLLPITSALVLAARAPEAFGSQTVDGERA